MLINTPARNGLEKALDEILTKVLIEVIEAEAQTAIEAVKRLSAERYQGTPLPGQLWAAQGGTYAGIMRGDDGQLYHLIVGPDSMDFEGQPWGGYDGDEDNAASAWDGLANTRALVGSRIDHPAAQAIAQINPADKHGDWYLPSQIELSLCRAGARHLFKPTWYWSSTQYSSDLAWCQGFEYGGQNIYFKGTEGRARAVRRLIIQ